MIKVIILILFFLSNGITQELKETGEYQVVNVYDLPKDITMEVGYSIPSYEQASRPLMRWEMISNNANNVTNKFFRFSDNQYFIEESRLTEHDGIEKVSYFRMPRNKQIIAKREKTVSNPLEKNIYPYSVKFIVMDILGDTLLIRNKNKNDVVITDYSSNGRYFSHKKGESNIRIHSPKKSPIDIIKNMPLNRYEEVSAILFDNLNTQDIILQGNVRIDNIIEKKFFAVVDKNNYLLWEKRTNVIHHGINIVFSESGDYFGIMDAFKYKTKGTIELEIINRSGKTIAVYPNILASNAGISDEVKFQYISDDDKYFITQHRGNIMVYDLFTGEKLHNLRFKKGYGLKRHYYRSETGFLYVIFTYPYPVIDRRTYIGVYPLMGDIEHPIMLINTGVYDPPKYRIYNFSVSKNGEEISMEMDETIKVYKLNF